ncbi:MAG: hypothetical protein IPL79_01860 [Myxococcales bacterium]|nr:hypothetical protein [Myxococcales bacterium]
MKLPPWVGPLADRMLGPRYMVGGAPATVAPDHVFRWDLDKTYLRTEFDSARDLFKSAFETAADKQAYPGATAVLRALHSERHRICIVSGSPRQMKAVLEAKLVLDGVTYDEFVLKNNLRNIVAGRFRALRSQIPYKLPALLASRVSSPPAPRETLFGDDAEADAIIYCLYADIVSGQVSPATLAKVLEASRAYPDEIELVLRLAAQVTHGDVVRRVFIHLDRRSPPQGFDTLGGRVVPVYNYFQTALVLYADGVLSARQVLFVATEMLATTMFAPTTLANSQQDLMRRGHLPAATLTALVDEWLLVSDGEPSAVEAAAALARLFVERRRTSRVSASLAAAELPHNDEPLDYVRLVDHEHERRRDRRKHGFR